MSAWHKDASKALSFQEILHMWHVYMLVFHRIPRNVAQIILELGSDSISQTMIIKVLLETIVHDQIQAFQESKLIMTFEVLR